MPKTPSQKIQKYLFRAGEDQGEIFDAQRAEGVRHEQANDQGLYGLQEPYAYLAKDLVYDLERDTGVEVDWLPYTLDIPAYLGSATLDTGGGIARRAGTRTSRRVKYSYMDCRRSNRRGLTIRGTQKIWDSSLANIGMLCAKAHGIFHAYHDRVFERFWRRELDIESVPVLAALLAECGAEAVEFPAYAKGAGPNFWMKSNPTPRPQACSASRASSSRMAILLGPGVSAPYQRDRATYLIVLIGDPGRI